MNAAEILIRRHKRLRLGDAVASIAQPIARTIDKITGQNIAGCVGCKKRQESLNNLTRLIH